MQRHESLHALEYLQKAGEGPDVLAATEQIQRMAGNTREAADVHATLRRACEQVQQWLGSCGDGRLRSRRRHVVERRSAVRAEARRGAERQRAAVRRGLCGRCAGDAEGAVSPSLLRAPSLLRGLHRIDVRVANPLTRNAIHRRIRIE
jgi:hypothetical protein